ncbi:TPA: threonine synthase [Candidatus Bathyarchaeota archaeon]|nr:threonine synthase [Candidatus Bathyarchaeota archaeon]
MRRDVNYFMRATLLGSLRCIKCGRNLDAYPPRAKCPICGGTVEYVIDADKLRDIKFTGEFSFWRYRPLLPEVKNIASMKEGGTPLYKAERLSEDFELSTLYLKDETRNPTNSFRDRSAALLVSNILDLKMKTAVCATNGNMGASLAAYCAKYGISCHAIIPKIVDMGKLAQMLVYDAIIEEHGETVDESIRRAELLAEETGWYQATPELNPLVIEAQKTIAFEVAEQFGVPDWFIVSMGSGGTAYSLWKGFRDLDELDKIDSLPKILGVQAEGCSPIVNTYLKDDKKSEKPFTHAIGIFVAEPLQKELALSAIKSSNGLALSVSDQEIFAAEQSIARLEGIFAEPASSGTIAALKKAREESIIDRDESVICLITGSGLKATDVLQALSKKRKSAMLGAELSTKEKILRLLSKRDRYGYELWKDLGKTMTRSAIYQHLNDLCSRGLLSSYLEEGKKYFKITHRGRRILRAIDEVKVLL